MKATYHTPRDYSNPLTAPARERPLWFHQAGLKQTASGNGCKLATTYQVRIRNRWRRVYACQISNAGTCYIGRPGAWEFIVEDIERKG
jgi:hypothetical protein